MSAPAAATTGRWDPAAALVRLPRATLLVVVLLVLPAGVGYLLGGPVGAPALVVGIVIGALTSVTVGYRSVQRFLPVLALSLVVGGLTTGTWWWAALATGAALVAGYSVRWSAMPFFTLSALVLVVAPRISGLRDIVVSVLFVLVGGILGAQLARRGGAPEHSLAGPTSVVEAVITAAVLGTAVGAACTIARLSGNAQGYWIPMTVLILAAPAAQSRASRTSHRLVGTLLGVAVATLVLWSSPPGAVVIVVVVLCLVLTFAVTGPYWLRVTFGAVMVVLLLAPSSTPLEVAENRLLTTAIGVALLGTAAGVAVLLARTGRSRLALPQLPEVP